MYAPSFWAKSRMIYPKDKYRIFSLKEKADIPLSLVMPMVKYQTLTNTFFVTILVLQELPVIWHFRAFTSVSYLTFSYTPPTGSPILICPSAVPTHCQHSSYWSMCSNTTILQVMLQTWDSYSKVYDFWIHWVHSLPVSNGTTLEGGLLEPETTALGLWLYHLVFDVGLLGPLRASVSSSVKWG